MIRVLLLKGNGSELIRSSLSGQMEVDLFVAADLESAYQIVQKKPIHTILAPAPDPNVSDSTYATALIQWQHDIRSRGMTTALLTYTLSGGSVLLTDTSAGISLCDPADPSFRSIISILRQAANKCLLERSFRDEYDLQRRTIMAMPIPYLRVVSGSIIGINPAMESLSGYLAEEFEQRPLTDIIIMETQSEDAVYHACLSCRNAEQIPVRIHQGQELSGDGLAASVFFIEDRREILELHAKIKETQRLCQEKLWLSETMVLKLSPDGTIIFANNATLTCSGYAGQDLAGCHISLLLPPVPDPEPVSSVSLFLGVANESEPTAIHIMEHLRSDGGKIYVAWTTRAYYAASGDLTGLLCIGTDMTEHTPEGEGRISTRIWRDKVIEGTDILPEVFDAILQACVEIAREGREGKPVGTAFLVGDRDAVMDRSRQLILNPFYGHPADMRMVIRKDVREMLKEYALLDGAFVVTGDGMLEAAGRYITVDSSSSSLPKGMGTRHSSTAAITSVTRTVGLVVSESGGRVSVIKDGKIVKVIG